MAPRILAIVLGAAPAAILAGTLVTLPPSLGQSTLSPEPVPGEVQPSGATTTPSGDPADWADQSGQPTGPAATARFPEGGGAPGAEAAEGSGSAPTGPPASARFPDGAVAPRGVQETRSAGPAIEVDTYAGGGTASALVHVPVTNLYPGTVRPAPDVRNPHAGDPDAATRGMTYFAQFNCSGCHAANGGGGMGPALSNHEFIYGSEPEQIYLSILQGRPHGMPAWGGMLPDTAIWDLVSYIRSISNAPSSGQWGKTTSIDTFDIEQVPAERIRTATPWQQVQPFSYGQPPETRIADPHAVYVD